jgi:ubiquitin conjugation factor E4 B
MSTQERRETERNHHRDEHVVKIEFLLANETVHMLSYFSAEMKAQFMLPEMVSRLAQMLNFFLVTLADPDKRKSLHVANPGKYHFNPKKLLHLIVNTYLSFADEAEFIDACAKDGRSFKPDIFQAAVHLFRGFANDATKAEKFDQLVLAVITQSQSDSNMEDQLGEIPEDFLDPIMQTLMLDPVKLPTSGKVMDRAVIMRILLTEHLDPFNRAELKPDMLESDQDTKDRIHTFMRSKGVDPASMMGANSP